MKHLTFILFVLLAPLFVLAQKTQQGLNYFLKPTSDFPYYVAFTEKKDSLWFRQVFYVNGKSLYMEGTYLDEACKTPHGEHKSFHPTKFQKSGGQYVNGKKEGVWLEFDGEGKLIDSAYYVTGRQTGVRMKWHSNGMASDSIQFDAARNGVQVSWYNDGAVMSAGQWTQDTVKKGRWKYYHPNGTVMATEDYLDGKLVAQACFTDGGQPIDSAFCVSKDPEPVGGLKGWKRFLENNLKPEIVVRNGIASGAYTVVVRFLVEKDGRLSDIKPLTNIGFGAEEHVVEIMKNAARWTPGQQHGKIVRSYHTQPITFAISGR